MDTYTKFKIAQKYRIWAFLVFLSCPVFLAISFKIKFIGYILCAIAFAIAVVLDMQYKCPVCNERFDTRVAPSKLKHCPKCATRLQD